MIVYNNSTSNNITIGHFSRIFAKGRKTKSIIKRPAAAAGMGICSIDNVSKL